MTSETVREANRKRALPEEVRKARRKATQRRCNLKSRYGISTWEYDRLLKSQGNKCAICRKVCSTGKRLAVDHDHETGRVRGLLCRRCNRGLGHFASTKELQRALNYLKTRKKT